MNELIGKYIGAGYHRAVFAHKKDPTLVIKVAHRHLSGHRNRMEWEVWQKAPEYIKKHLVPCVSISDDGVYLVCKRGDAVQKIKKYPRGFRKSYGDTKTPTNWVKIDGRLLLADYANDNIYNKFCK